MKKWAILILALLLLLSCEPSDGGSDDGGGGSGDESTTGYYTVDDFDPLVGLTEEQVREHYEKNYSNTATSASAVNGYDKENLVKGTLTDDAIMDFVRRTNFFRSFHQLPPINMPEDSINDKCQEAALSMIIQNDISHTPIAEGFTYATPTADDAASSSNLAISWSSSPDYAYTTLLDNLVMDTGVDSTGHRKWFLYPGQKGAGYGYLYRDDAPGSYPYADTLVQWVMEYEDVSSTWDKPVLYPAAGAFPIEFTVDDFNRLVDFTLYWYKASFDACTVSIKNGASTITSTIKDGEAFSSGSMPPAGLIFTPGSKPAAGDEWTVTINGISGKDTSSLSYTIKFIELGVRSRSLRHAKVKK